MHEKAIEAGAVPEVALKVIQEASALAVQFSAPLPALVTLMFWPGVVKPVAPKKFNAEGAVARIAVFTPRVTGMTSGEFVAPGAWRVTLPV